MVMMSYFKFGSVLLCLMLLLSGCRTLQVPDFDSIKFPKFREEAEHIGDYPEVGEAPLTPDDLKSDREWDKAANRMLKTHASLETPKDYSGRSLLKKSVGKLKSSTPRLRNINWTTRNSGCS